MDPPTGDATAPSRVVYIGHLPHGFYEKQLKEYFSQFGNVTKVRVSRSKRTTRSRGYAFVQFQLPEVAAIAADTMDGYMLFKQKLKCHCVPETKQHTCLFKHSGRRMVKKPWQEMEAKRHNRERSEEQQAARLARFQKRDEKRQRRIQAAGIEYEWKQSMADV